MKIKNNEIRENVEAAIYGTTVLNDAIEEFKSHFKRVKNKPNGEIIHTNEGYVEVELDGVQLPTFKITIDVNWEWVYDFDVDYTIESETSEITIDSHGDWFSIEW